MSQISFNRVILPFLLVSGLSLLGAWVVAQFGFDYRYLLYILLFVIIVVVLLRGARSLQLGFTLWIWMFVLGYRTIHITSYFLLHPLLVFLALLFLILIFILRSQPEIRLRLPAWVWIFGVFWVWGFIMGFYHSLSGSNMIADALNFIFLIPVFLIVLYLSREPDFWKSSMLAFLGVGVLISLLGSLEYYYPQVFQSIPGLVETNVEGLASFSGFTRASFAFWGQTSVGILCALSLPMIWALPHFYKSKFSWVIAAVLTAIIGYGVYLSGTRDAWLMILISSVFIAYFALKWLGVALSAVFWLIASRFFSAQMWTLILSVTTPFVGAPITDTSLQKRILRQQDAFQLALRNPLGVGWTGSGWVHGDFTQVAANLGILAGIIFILWYLHTLYRAWQKLRQSPHDFILQTLFLSFILCGLILATEGVEVLPQFVMPVWFVWALLEAYLQKEGGVSLLPPSSALHEP